MKDNPFKAMTVFEMNRTIEDSLRIVDIELVGDPSGSEWRRVGMTAFDGADEFFHDLDGAGHVCRIQFNERILPGKVIREHVDLLAADIEKREGRKPGRKALAELREEVEQELLPKAFIRRSVVHVIFRNTRMFVFTSSAKKCDDVIKVVLDTLSCVHPGPDIVLRPVDEGLDMTTYLTGKAIYDDGAHIASGNSAVLRREGTEVIRVKDRDVGSSEVQQALKNGYRAHELGVSLMGEVDARIDFKLTDRFVFKGITFSDEIASEYQDEKQEALDFHATAWMVCREYDNLVTTVLREVQSAAKQESDEEL